MGGKTTILSAINYVLTGEGKVLRDDEKSCKVKLVVPTSDTSTMTVVRSKGPGRLRVICRDKVKDVKTEYEDSVAQGVINAYFGENFTTTSYILQKSFGSFVYMSPSDKLELLERFTEINNEEISKIKKKTKEKIKSLKENLSEEVGKISVLEDQYKSLSKKLTAKSLKTDIKTTETVSVMLNNNEEKYIQYKSDISTLRSDVDDLTNQYNNYQKTLSKLQNISDKISDIDSKRDVLTKYIFSNPKESELTDQLLSLKKKLKEYNENKENIGKHKKYKQESENYDILLSKEKELFEKTKTELTTKLYESTKVQSQIEQLPLLKQSIESDLLFLNDLKRYVDIVDTSDNDKKELLLVEEKIVKYTKLLSDSKDQKKELSGQLEFRYCPKCKVPIKIINNSLVCSDSIDQKIRSKDQLLSEIQTIKDNEKVCQQKIDSLLLKKKELANKISSMANTISNNNSILSRLDDCLPMSRHPTGMLKLSGGVNISSLIKEKDILISNNRKELDVLSKKVKEIENLTLKLKEFESFKESSSLKTLKAQLNKLKANLKDQIDNTIDLDPTKVNAEILSISVLLSQIRKAVKDEEELNSNLLKAVNERSKYRFPDPVDVKEITESKTRIDKLEKKLLKLESEKSSLQELKDYLVKKEECDKWKDKLDKNIQSQKTIQKQLSASELLLVKILESESKALQTTLDNINYYIQIYLDKFYSIDNPISIELSAFKETKKLVKPSIFINIFYKGKKRELKQLSGGECDRINVCFTLALNEIYGKNIMMLDESIISLDAGLVENILGVLKEISRNKLILMTFHNVIEGYFDRIISL